MKTLWKMMYHSIFSILGYFPSELVKEFVLEKFLLGTDCFCFLPVFYRVSPLGLKMRKTNPKQILESVCQDLSLTTLLIKSVQNVGSSRILPVVKKQVSIVPVFFYLICTVWRQSFLLPNAHCALSLTDMQMYRHKQVGDFCFICHQTGRVPIKYKNGNAVYFASQLSTELCWSYLKETAVTILTERQICLEIILNELHCLYQSVSKNVQRKIFIWGNTLLYTC